MEEQTNLATRRRVLLAAEELFSRQGYNETSVRDIGIETNLQAASLYHHFPSKRAILDYITCECVQMLSDLPPVVLPSEISIHNIVRSISYTFGIKAKWVNQLLRSLNVILQEQFRIPECGNIVISGIMIHTRDRVVAALTELERQNHIVVTDKLAVALEHTAVLYLWLCTGKIGMAERDSMTGERTLEETLCHIYERNVRIIHNED
jgi:AcrR family transcriptional regulator